MDPNRAFAEVCARLDAGLAVALPCPPDLRLMGGLILTLVLLGPLTVVLFVLRNRPAGSRHRDDRLTADRITRLKARMVAPRSQVAAEGGAAPIRVPLGRAQGFGTSAANLPSRPVPLAAGRVANCRWRYQGWRPGTRIARWACGTCGAEASSLHERHPPVDCLASSQS